MIEAASLGRATPGAWQLTRAWIRDRCRWGRAPVPGVILRPGGPPGPGQGLTLEQAEALARSLSQGHASRHAVYQVRDAGGAPVSTWLRGARGNPQALPRVHVRDIHGKAIAVIPVAGGDVAWSITAAQAIHVTMCQYIPLEGGSASAARERGGVFLVEEGRAFRVPDNWGRPRHEPGGSPGSSERTGRGQ